MRRRTLLYSALICAAVSAARADPISVGTPPGKMPGNHLLITFAALWAESLIVVVLARRKRWLRDTIVWFGITLATFIGFVAVPLTLTGFEMNRPGKCFDGLVLLLEAVVVLIETLILWQLWLRKDKAPAVASLLRSLGISMVGNLASYGLSIAAVYGVFHFWPDPTRLG